MPNVINVPDAQSHYVSRLQLLIQRDRLGLPLAFDFRSLNGTTVNAQFIQYSDDKKLEDGDIIVLAGAAVFRFRPLSPPLLPFLSRKEQESSPPPEGTWALLVNGKNKDTIPLTRDEYFLSANEQGEVNLGSEKVPDSLLRIEAPPSL